MKAIIDDFSTDIILSKEEMMEHCKIGKGGDTCIWVLIGKEFKCSYYHKPISLLDRFRQGLTVAKRDGCDKVKNFDDFETGGEIEF